MGSSFDEKLWEDARTPVRARKEMARADKKLAKFADKAEPGRCYTLHEIAQAMGVTRERVRQIQARALKKLYKRLGRVFKSENITPEEAISMVRGVGRVADEYSYEHQKEDR